MPIIKVGEERIKFPDSMSMNDIKSVLDKEFASTRTPEQTEALRKKRIADIPELTGSMKSLSENLGFTDALAGLTAFDPDEFGQILRNSDPNIGIVTTPEGERIAVNNSTGAAFSINKVGPSIMDAVQFGGTFAAFTPAGRGSQGLLSLAGKSAATQAGIEAGQAAAGGEFNPGDVAVAGVAAPVGKVVGDKVLAPTANAVSTAVKAPFAGFKASTRDDFVRAVADFAEIDQVPSVGQASGDGVRQGIETLSSKVFGGQPIRRALDSTTNKMKTRLQAIASDLSTKEGDDIAGLTITRGIKGDGGFVDRFQSKSGELWKAVDDKIGDSSESSINATRKLLDETVRNDSFGQILNNPKLSGLKQVFDDVIGSTRINQVTQTRETVTTVPYATLKSLRSQVGEMLGGKELISDIPRSQLKRLYGALSKDIKEVAQRSGALKDFTRANNFTRAGHTRLDNFVEKTVNKGQLEDVFKAATRGREGIQTINAVKRSLKPEEWEVIVSNVIRKMGRATSGQQDELGEAFSVSKFLTDWDKLGKAKKALFSGSQKLNEYSKNLDTIARVSRKFKDDVKAMANPSGTAQALINTGLAGGGGASLAFGNANALAMIVGGVAINNLSARLVTNPRFVKWLAQSATTKNLPSHITRLSAVASASSADEQEAILSLLETLKQISPQDTQQ